MMVLLPNILHHFDRAGCYGVEALLAWGDEERGAGWVMVEFVPDEGRDAGRRRDVRWRCYDDAGWGCAYVCGIEGDAGGGGA